MIDEKLLASLPKKYQPYIDEYYKNSKGFYCLKLKAGYEFKLWKGNGKFELPKKVKVLELFRGGLNVPIPTITGGKREGAGRKNKGYKMVSIRMTEEEKVAVKEYLKQIRKDGH